LQKKLHDFTQIYHKRHYMLHMYSHFTQLCSVPKHNERHRLTNVDTKSFWHLKADHCMLCAVYQQKRNLRSPSKSYNDNMKYNYIS